MRSCSRFLLPETPAALPPRASDNYHRGRALLYALDADRGLLLAALLLDRLQCHDIAQGGPLQSRSGGQQLQRTGGNPWIEIRATLGLAQKTAATGILGTLLPIPIDSAGNRTEGRADNRDHKNLIFRETDAIGHPLSSLTGRVTGAGLLCASQTTSFVPYFQSGLDALSWRQEIPEILYPASLIPGLREIGSWPLQTWGGLYPRTGWTTQAEEPKAAAINAQRAGDIVTRAAQPHIYLPLSAASYMHNDLTRIIDHWVDDGLGGLINHWFPRFSGQKVWPPGPLREKNHRTGTWQMLLPRSTTGCGVFGSNDLASLAGWGGGKVDPGGDYAWSLWRPYKCCSRRGQRFLFEIDWFAYPP